MRPIRERMAAAVDKLDAVYFGKRRPKAFYLIAADWEEFLATNPAKVRTMFGNNPPVEREDVAFYEVPVRPYTGQRETALSRLYDNTTTGRNLPE